MTTFLRYAHLSLVAYAALAIILLLAFAAEELKPCAEKQGREAPDRRREAERKKRHAGAREGHTCQDENAGACKDAPAAAPLSQTV